jgi:pimeloyl-ACP methyl ester carboxylesterase
MPEIAVNGARLHYLDRGEGAESIVFSHSYLLDHRHFEAQIEALSDRYRCLAYDHRGHGQSEVSAGGYEMENLYADAVAFIEAVGGAPCHFVGLSTGGFIGLRLGIRRPELLRSLVLMDTSAEAEPAGNRLRYTLLFLILGLLGYGPVLNTGMRLLFGPRFLEQPERRQEVAEWRRRLTAHDRRAMIRFGRGIAARASVRRELPTIRTPTLVIVGEDDVATPPVCARRIAQGIPNARMCLIPGAGHLTTVEQPAAVTAALVAFLANAGLGAHDRANLRRDT